ncbi:hypothetical protein AMATHDRAFT_136684 [Amanita thiersii Skay4041]|uniref:Uncharacterized protein n=1 Tax=Amanita thiersii Skay4041 TaxID=703135 RepID=A0A2A9NUB6_9AGAR|nr:hypothetical protein AMATHDRAFT_136684 [Amanita thiersii Skay4041]
MSTESLPVIFYRYGPSAFTQKIDMIMTLKNLQHYRVNVQPWLPRPEITQLLGITYRRIPLLAIGNDVYCDTSIIVPELERRFPASNGYGTIYPGNKSSGLDDSNLFRLFAQFYSEPTFMSLASGLWKWDTLPEELVKDRELEINREELLAQRGVSRSNYNSHLVSSSKIFPTIDVTNYVTPNGNDHQFLLDQQLGDGREWLFNTEGPSLADISVYFFFTWMKNFPAAQGLVDPSVFPHLFNWKNRLSELIEDEKGKQHPPIVITGEQGADMIVSAPHEPSSVVGFDASEAGLLGIKESDMVSIAPVDTGINYPTIGKLVALSKSEMVIQVSGTKGSLRCHFPRLGFSIKLAPESVKNKL